MPLSSMYIPENTFEASILVVEDQLDQRELIEAALQDMGYEVITACNGVEAIHCLEQTTPDLIVSDVNMPEMDGFEFLRHLRAHEGAVSIPVILLTARGSQDDIVAGLNLGADDYLTKPFSLSELSARVRSKITRVPIPVDNLLRDRQTGLLNYRSFKREIEQEIVRSERWKTQGVLAHISINELALIRDQFGKRASGQVAKQIAALITFDEFPLEVLGRDRAAGIFLLIPEVSAADAHKRLSRLARRVAAHNFLLDGERVRVTPIIGYASINKQATTTQLYEQALTAGENAGRQLDLEPLLYSSEMKSAAHSANRITQTMRALNASTKAVRNWRPLLQISLTLLLGLITPFLIYALLGSVGLDITLVVYIGVIVALLATSALIWWEGLLALRRPNLPEMQSNSYPPASAIIAAYLPNEAATIEATLNAFLSLDYPGPLQVILAYNTPHDLPIEKLLQELAVRDSRFTAYRVAGSTSKAQNINAALRLVTGEFVGIFDADHHPDPGSFQRAWRWLGGGYDVVQGHCLVRNGDASWVSRTIAVEFEAIYAVSHPGRAKLHNFGIFGGSNGYWKTEILRQTRMRSFMLTEDIDSSFRMIQQGYKIVADPELISRELAPITVQAFWNQRLRWAQGWYQVALQQSGALLRSQELSLRQKMGIIHLLVWREIYPWISLQIIPIIAYWAWSRGGLGQINWFVPIFVVTTIVTLGTGPGQLIFIYRVGHHTIKKHKYWFWRYLLLAFLFTEFKNLIARVAQVKEIMGERVWHSTPRT